MDANNLVVVRGAVVGEPRRRDLPSGGVVTQFDVAVRSDGHTTSVPIAVHGTDVAVAQGDAVVVVGSVRRRFFRVGGVTQSRTEVVADQVVRASRRRAVERALAAAGAMFASDPSGEPST